MHFGRFIRHIGNSYVCHDSTEIEIKKERLLIYVLDVTEKNLYFHKCIKS